jgi:hypothetical protein
MEKAPGHAEDVTDPLRFEVAKNDVDDAWAGGGGLWERRRRGGLERYYVAHALFNLRMVRTRPSVCS